MCASVRKKERKEGHVGMHGVCVCVCVAHFTEHVCGKHCMNTGRDEREVVGGQEVKNKRHSSSSSSSDLSDVHRLG